MQDQEEVITNLKERTLQLNSLETYDMYLGDAKELLTMSDLKRRLDASNISLTTKKNKQILGLWALEVRYHKLRLDNDLGYSANRKWEDAVQIELSNFNLNPNDPELINDLRKFLQQYKKEEITLYTIFIGKIGAIIVGFGKFSLEENVRRDVKAYINSLKKDDRLLALLKEDMKLIELLRSNEGLIIPLRKYEKFEFLFGGKGN